MKQTLMKTSRHLRRWLAAAALAAALPVLAGPPLTGGSAPLIFTHTQDGAPWRLSDYLGKRMVLLYFYPIDDTAESSAVATTLRDNMEYFKQAGVVVAGVSFDGQESHRDFIFKYNLDFPLLTDDNGVIADAYGARIGPGKVRDRLVTYLVSFDGNIIHVTDSPDPVVQLKEIVTAIVKSKGKRSS
jgi:thioredoxin-dependent peroxiredoxin